MVRAATAAASAENILTSMFPNPTKQQKVLPSMIHLITQLKRQPQRNTIQAPSSKTNHLQILIMKWASTQENLSSGVCEHRRRPACAFAQSDQRLCSSRFGKMHITHSMQEDNSIHYDMIETCLVETLES